LKYAIGIWAAIGLALAAWQPASAQNAVTYQITPAHTGGTAFPQGLKLPLQLAWSRTFGRDPTYPIVADGKVFVNLATPVNGPLGTTLTALDAQTGATVWSKPLTLPEVHSSASAYDAGRIFSVTNTGVLTAYNAGTGTQLWRRSFPESYFTAGPTAGGGMVYLSGGGLVGQAYGVNQGSGQLVWKNTFAVGGPAFATLSIPTGKVFVGYPCNLFTMAASTGQLGWKYEGACVGGQTGLSALYANRIFLSFGAPAVASDLMSIFDATTGKWVGQLNDVVAAPAFYNGIGYFVRSNRLSAFTVPAMTPLWNFALEPYLDFPQPVYMAPIVVNGKVIMVSYAGDLWVLDGTTGKQLQHMSFGTTTGGNSMFFSGLTAGEGVILVPVGKTLFAFKSAN